MTNVHFVIAEYNQAPQPSTKYQYIVGYCLDGRRTWDKVLHKLRELGIETYNTGSGDTMVAAIDDFNKNHRESGGHVNRDEAAWWHVGSRDEPEKVKGVILVGDFKDSRPMVAPPPVKMPNGQVGYICTGKCHGFFSCVDANCAEGFICRACKG